MKTYRFTPSAAELAAILDGSRSQFRRPVKPQPDGRGYDPVVIEGVAEWMADADPSELDMRAFRQRCPWGGAGDELWVQELWRQVGFDTVHNKAQIAYRADGEHSGKYHWVASDRATVDAGWQPAITMPRWASRLTLRVTNVQVELNDGTWWWVVSVA